MLQYIHGTIFVWVPRFAYKLNEEGEIGEIAYIKGEATPGGEWEVPYTFFYEVEDETKPNFSLTGVWIEKDVDTECNDKIDIMNQEESIYGFIANTKAERLTGEDRDVFEKYVVGIETLIDSQINNPRNRNRVRLQIINTNKVEPIKANIKYNEVEERLEIRVTYSANGINKILNDYGEALTLIEENGVIYADTGESTLGKGTYKFTVIDNKGNKKELSITPNIDSIFKVAYINGIDNMSNTATYTKAGETRTTEEKNLIDQLYDKLYETNPDSTIRYRRAIADSNKAITVIEDNIRTSEDEQMYLWGKYIAIVNAIWKSESGVKSKWMSMSSTAYRYRSANTSNDSPYVTLSNGTASLNNSFWSGFYTSSKDFSFPTSNKNLRKYYYWTSYTADNRNRIVQYTGTSYYSEVTYSKGELIERIIQTEDAYENGKEDSTKKYWYERLGLSPKYTLCKYDADLNLKSTYDVDTKTLTTEGIDISNKGRNKVKLTLKTSGTAYKAYISNDKTNWKEVTDITSGIPKELDVDGWDNLYIKTETNLVRIDNIDVAYYKD